MRPSNSIVLLAALVSSVQCFAGFSIPEGQPYGVYSVHLDVNGTQVHTKLDTAPSVAASQPHGAKFRRGHRNTPEAEVQCSDYGILDAADTDAANAELDDQCNGADGVFVPKKHNFYAFSGGTVAFFCNLGDDTRCDAVTRAGFSLAVTGICGSYRAGWGTIPEQDISYGYDHASAKFCGTGPGTDDD